MTIDRATIKTWHSELDAMLKEWAAARGLKFEGGNISYDASEFSYRPKFTALNADGTVKLSGALRSKIDWALLCAGHGDLHAEDVLNKKFRNFWGDVVTVTSFNPKGKQYPWIVSKANGTLVKCSIEALCGFQKPAA